MVKRRVLYPLLLISLFFVLHSVVSPLIHSIFLDSLGHFMIHKWILLCSTSIAIILTVILMYEGRRHLLIIAIGGCIIATRVIDAVRFWMYPMRTMEGNLLSFWGGVFIFAFSLGLIKDILFRFRTGIYLLFVGILTTLRFPYFVDMLYYYYEKFGPIDPGHSLYYYGILVIHYFIVGLTLFALDGIVQNNIDEKIYIA